MDSSSSENDTTMNSAPKDSEYDATLETTESVETGPDAATGGCDANTGSCDETLNTTESNENVDLNKTKHFKLRGLRIESKNGTTSKFTLSSVVTKKPRKQPAGKNHMLPNTNVRVTDGPIASTSNVVAASNGTNVMVTAPNEPEANDEMEGAVGFTPIADIETMDEMADFTSRPTTGEQTDADSSVAPNIMVSAANDPDVNDGMEGAVGFTPIPSTSSGIQNAASDLSDDFLLAQIEQNRSLLANVMVSAVNNPDANDEMVNAVGFTPITNNDAMTIFGSQPSTSGQNVAGAATPVALNIMVSAANDPDANDEMEGAVGFTPIPSTSTGIQNAASDLSDDFLLAQIEQNRSLLAQITDNESLMAILATDMLNENQFTNANNNTDVKPFVNDDQDPFYGCKDASAVDLKPFQFTPSGPSRGDEYKPGEKEWLLNRIKALEKKQKVEVIVIDSSDEEEDHESFKPNAHSTGNDEPNA